MGTWFLIITTESNQLVLKSSMTEIYELKIPLTLDSRFLNIWTQIELGFEIILYILYSSQEEV